MKIAVLAGADVVPPIEIVGKIKGAEVYGILMDYTALCVIFILYIDLTLEILNRTEIPVAVIRISMHQRCCSTTALRCVIVNPFFMFSITSFPLSKCVVLRLRPQFP